MTEHAISIALPYSAREGDAVHVSVFITPQLKGGADATLGDFAAFLHWAKALKDGLTLTLSDQNGQIECTPLLDPIRADAWDALFPATTPVRANEVPDWSDRQWRSFDAAAADQLGKAMVTATALLSPVQPLTPSRHPLTREITKLVANEMPSTRGDRGEKIEIDDERLNKTLDRLTSQLPPREGRPQSSSSFNVSTALATFHAVRNYYSRPEAQVPYQEAPTTASAPMPTPEPEFHERVAHLGDHPEVLRALGLVIDLAVADVSRLRGSTWLRATIEVAGFSVGSSLVRTGLTNAAPRVACRATADGALVTTAESDEWIDGALALGRPGRFTVLDTETDGTALKMEMFLRELPHLWNSERNTEPVDAATPALRASGLTVARRGQGRALQDRLGAQKVLASKLGAPRRPGGGRPRRGENDGGPGTILIPVIPPTLHSEDVARGLRVEVWDTAGTVWRSLHARHTTAFVEGLAAPLDLGDGFGFIQSAPAEQSPNVVDAPINVHESVFGWEGWSLSVGKPGRRVREVPVPQPDGTAKIEEVVEDTPAALPTDAPNRIRFEHRITPDTLPPLRFGRSYAFRAWLVDLAGNVRPEVLPAATPTPAPQPGGLLDLLRGSPRLRDVLLTTTPRATAALDLFVAKASVKARANDALVVTAARAPRARRAAGAAGSLSGGRATASLHSPLGALRASRAGAVEAAFQEHLDAVAAGTTGPAAEPADTAALADTLIAPLIERQLRDISGLGGLGGPGHGGRAPAADDYTRAAETVTAPRPFLRWDPVAPPALVPRALYSEGESVRVLVIRSAVTQNAATLEVEVSDSLDLAQRHVAPPKTSQTQAELHGAFDPIIGAHPTPASLRAALAVALRENGSFFDLDVANPDNPGGRDPVGGVALVTEPTAAGPLRTLPLPAGEAPAAGQYVVHDVDELVLPYLPDPLARGVSIVFPDARLFPALPTPFGIEGFTADYPVDARGWPFVESYRLILASGTTARVDVANRVLAFALPAGTVQRARIGSSLQQRALRMLGVWRSFPTVITSNVGVTEAALDGYLWALTPALPLRLVHAVPRPVEAPRPVTFRAERQQAATDTAFVGSVHLHGASTEQLSAEASWVDVVDNPGDTRWRERPSSGLAFTTITNEIERLAVFEPRTEEWMPREQADADDPTVWFHRVTHDFGDTKHRRVSYRLRASTRFREFFPPAQLVGDPAVAFDDGASTVSAEIAVSVPSSARPAPPIVHSTIPLFRWSHDDPTDSPAPPASATDDTAQRGQPIAEQHERLAGVRIYLQRPWFSSGEGELLAVLTGNAVSSAGPVSAWAQDPIWADDASVASVSLGNAQLEDPWRDMGVDDALHPARPITSEANLTLPLTADGSKTYRARAWGYRPQFNEARGLWYVDVAISPGATAWPFLRLAVARFQPESLPGLELSSPVRCDFVQVPPERAVVASRTDERCVRVVVTGPVPRRRWAFGDTAPDSRVPLSTERVMVARLQRKDPELAGDLGWITVDVSELPVRATDAATRTVSWGDELRADQDVTLRRPGPGASTWRVVVEEWERFAGDPLLGPTVRGIPVDPEHQPLTSEQRMVFADEVYL